MKKIIKSICFALIIIFFFNITICYATIGGGIGDLNLDDYNPISKANLGTSIVKVINKILGAIQVIGIIIAVVLIGYIGMKSVFGSLSEKSEVKQSVGPFLLGTIFLLAGTTIVRFIVSAVE